MGSAMKKKLLLWTMIFLLAASFLTGCGGSSGKGSDSAAAAPMTNYSAEQTGEMAEEKSYYGDAGSIAAVPPAAQEGAKIIYTAEMNLETTDFESAVKTLAALTEELGGYYGSSSLSNGGTYRSGNYTIRIPAENYRTFLDRAGSACHLLSLYEYTDDVTAEYFDTSGRLDTEKAKLARLQELLGQAKDMEDIITLESAIAQAEENIDRLSGEIRYYDAQVDYSTVTVYLREVYRLSNVEEPAQDFPSRIGAALKSGWNGFVSGMESLAVALAYGWMWLLLAAVIALVVILIVRRSAKRRAKARAAQGASYTAPTYTGPEEKRP